MAMNKKEMATIEMFHVEQKLIETVQKNVCRYFERKFIKKIIRVESIDLVN